MFEKPIYSPLRMDLQYLFENVDRFITKIQEKYYPILNNRTRLVPEMLGYDHPNTLRLLDEAGGDGQPICHLSQKEVKSVFSKNNQFLLPPETLFRIARFFNLNVYYTTHILIKGKMEEKIAEYNGYDNGLNSNFDLILTETNKEEYNNFFTDNDTRLLIEIIENINCKLMSTSGYNYKTYDILVNDYILNSLYCNSLSSLELQRYSHKESIWIKKLNEGSPEQQEKHNRLKSIWQELENKYAEKLQNREDYRKRKEQVRNNYLEIFGPDEYDLWKAMHQNDYLELKIELLQNDRNLSEEEVENEIAEFKNKRSEELEDLETRIFMATHPNNSQPDEGIIITEKEYIIYREKCKRAIREAEMLLHPDTIQHQSGYQLLTDLQKKDLREKLDEVIRIRDNELNVPKWCIAYNMRTLDSVHNIIYQARQILANAGVNFTIDLEIQGSTISEQLEFLTNEIPDLEQKIVSVKEETRVLREDPDILEKESILNNPQIHSQIIDKIQRRIEAIKQSIIEKQAVLRTLFEKFQHEK